MTPETRIKAQTVLSSHQPAYLPWLGLVHKLWLCDHFILFDCVEYEKGSYINRNRIMAPNKQPVWLTVPLKKRAASDSNLIRDIKIDNTKPWKKKHLSTISHSYSKTPGYKAFFPIIKDFFEQDFDNLSFLGLKTLELFMKLFDFNRPISLSSKLELKEKKDSRVLEMCLKKGCDTFIFGELGLNYADRNTFLNNRITPIFQKFIHPVYDQTPVKDKKDNSFYSHLSALDYIMLNPDNPLKAFENNMYRTKESLIIRNQRNCFL